MLSIASNALPSTIRDSFSRHNSDSEHSKDGDSSQKNGKTDSLGNTRLNEINGNSSIYTPPSSKTSTPKEEDKQLGVEPSTSLQESVTGAVKPTTNVDTTKVIVQPSSSPSNSIASLKIEHFDRNFDDDLTTPIAGDIASQIPQSSNSSSITPNDRSDSLISDDSRKSTLRMPTKSNSAKSSKNKKRGESIIDETLIDSPPLNGCVPAAPRRNQEFHTLFRSVPEEDYLINDFGCALQKEILVQGRLYVSASHVCFNANIFGWVTNLVIAFSDIVAIEKRTTAFVIPNAIQICTLHAKHFFTTFISRDSVYDLLLTLWKQVHPTLTASSLTESECGASRKGSDASETSEDNFLSSDDDDEGKSTNEQRGGTSRKKFALPKLTLDPMRPMRYMRGSSNSTLSSDDDKTDKDVFQSLPPSPKKRSSSLLKEQRTHLPRSKSDIDIDSKRSEKFRPTSPRNQSRHTTSNSVKKRRPTQCVCLKKNQHYENASLDTKLTGSVEKIFNLLFTSEFVNRYLIEEDNCTDLEVGEWNTENPNWKRLTSYIKPLNNPLGPKSTKCITEEECQHRDFDNYVTCTQTTTTPDVPSGSSFSVKNRICIMWAGANESRVIVTCKVEWTKSSWLKGTIERACIDGQQTHWKNLTQVIKKYIAAHPSEFTDESGALAQGEETVDSEVINEKNEKTALKRAQTRTKDRIRPATTEVLNSQENESATVQHNNIVINMISSILNSIQSIAIPSTNTIILLILSMLVINNFNNWLTLQNIGNKLDSLDGNRRSDFFSKPREQYTPLFESIENEENDPLWKWLQERSKMYEEVDKKKGTFHTSNSEPTSSQDDAATSSEIKASPDSDNNSHHFESKPISSQSLYEQIGDIYRLIQVAEGHVKKLVDVAEFENSYYKDSSGMNRKCFRD